MQIANVAPVGMLKDVIDTDEKYHLVLTEMVNKNGKYADFYRKRSLVNDDYVILDNDAYEADGSASSITKVLKAALYVRPSEIILPDEMFGPTCAKDTVAASASAVPILKAAGFRRYMAVPHGNTLNEWVACAQELAKLEGVVSLGIAEKDALKLTDGDRGQLVRAIIGLRKKIHLLGMMEDMSDIQDRWVRQAVRGVDGGKLIVWGMYNHDVRVGQVPPYPGRPEGYMDLGAQPSDTVDVVRRNITYWRSYAGTKMILAEAGAE